MDFENRRTTSALVASLLLAIAADGLERPHAIKDWVRKNRVAPGSDEAACGNYSRTAWIVGIEKGELNVRPVDARDHEGLLPPLPADLPARVKELAPRSRSYLRAQRIAEGWLVGVDDGEYGGGGLWLTDRGGTQPRKLSSLNVRGFAEVSGRLLVAMGLAHDGRDAGQLLEVVRDGHGRTVRPVTNLGASPSVLLLEPKGTLIVVSALGVARVKRNAVQWLARSDYHGLAPRSAVALPSGQIFVGMNRFVVALTPRGNSYREDWFVPKECAAFEIRDLECHCR